MLLTEDETRKKWCPFARVLFTAPMDMGGAVAAAFNRDTDSTATDPCRCIASKCMAWRWARAVKATNGTWNVWPDEERDGPGRGFSSPERVGYCGLAGNVD